MESNSEQATVNGCDSKIEYTYIKNKNENENENAPKPKITRCKSNAELLVDHTMLRHTILDESMNFIFKFQISRIQFNVSISSIHAISILLYQCSSNVYFVVWYYSC